MKVSSLSFNNAARHPFLSAAVKIYPAEPDDLFSEPPEDFAAEESDDFEPPPPSVPEDDSPLTDFEDFEDRESFT